MADKRALEEVQLQREKAALQRAQDRIALRYREEREQRAAETRDSDAQTDSTTMPKSVRELPRSAGPQGGGEPSAEAHSAPAN